MVANVQEDLFEKLEPANYTLGKQIGFKLSRTARLMQQRLEVALATQGVSRLAWCVLSSIGFERISTPSGLADNIGVTRPTLSRLIKSMSQDGLIEIRLDSQDGRNRHLSLTSDGHAKLMACRPLVQNNNAHFAQKLSAEQMQRLHEVTDALMKGERVLNRMTELDPPNFKRIA